MNILAIETSCDETSACLMKNNKIINNIVHSQQEHKKYKGVVPEIASRVHSDIIEKIVKESLKKGKSTSEEDFKNIDLIAVTSGPGLFGSLSVGISYAKALAVRLNKPILEVNHLEGHILSVLIENKVDFPYISLLLSGGTSQIILVKDIGSYEILSGSLDDAVGEGFDKIAKMLDLPYPGGPIIEKLAEEGNKDRYKLPISMKNKKVADFSISGIKSATIRLLNTFKEGKVKIQDAQDIAASFQNAVLSSVLNKLDYLFKNNPELSRVKGICLTGGVANNKYFTDELKKIANSRGINFYKVSNEYCADNAAMIANAANLRYKRYKYNSDLNFKPKSRWAIDQITNKK